MPGTKSEKAVAASITPAAAPKIELNKLLEICLKKSAGKAPTPVAKPAKILAMKPITTILPKTRYKLPIKQLNASKPSPVRIAIRLITGKVSKY